MPYISFYPDTSSSWKVYKYRGETSLRVNFSFTTDLEYSDISVSTSPAVPSISASLRNLGTGNIGVAVDTDRNVVLTFSSLKNGQVKQLSLNVLTLSGGINKPALSYSPSVVLYNDSVHNRATTKVVAWGTSSKLIDLQPSVSWLSVSPTTITETIYTDCEIIATPDFSMSSSIMVYVDLHDHETNGYIGSIPIVVNSVVDNSSLALDTETISVKTNVSKATAPITFNFWNAGTGNICMTEWSTNVPWSSIVIDPLDSCSTSAEDIKLGTVSFSTETLSTGTFSGEVSLKYTDTVGAVRNKKIPLSLSVLEEGLSVSVSPASLNIQALKNKTEKSTVKIYNNSQQSVAITISKTASWCSITSAPVTVPAESVRSFDVNVQNSTIGFLYDIIKVDYTSSTAYGSISIPLSVTVTEADLSVDAGPDVTVQSGRLVRDGIVVPTPTTSNEVEAKWNTGSIANKGTGTSLIVDLPSPVSAYQDYIFELEANCSSCNPIHAADTFTVRVVKSAITSFSINPADISIDLSDGQSHSVIFSANLLPTTVAITKYTWSDELTNPVKMVSPSEEHKSSLTISSWAINGDYQINCNAETVSGNVVASATVTVSGSSIIQISTAQTFLNEDNFYGIQYFIQDSSTEDGVSEIGDITQQTVFVPPDDIPVPCSFPSVCSLTNNKRTGSNEQYIYIAYQAFVLYKWQIYIRQIRLSTSAVPVLPTYVSPYNTIGLIKTSDTTTSWTIGGAAQYAHLDSTAEIDYLLGKIYWFNNNIIYRANLDGTVEEVLYTDVAGTVEDIKLDITAATNKLFFITKTVTGATNNHRIYRSDPTNVAGTMTQLASYSSATSTSAKMSLSKDFVFAFWSESNYIYKQAKSGGAIATIKTGASNYIFAANNSTNSLYLINFSTGTISTYDSDSDTTTDVYTLPTGAVDSSSVPFASASTVYISNNDGSLISWDIGSSCIEYRTKDSDVTRPVSFSLTNTLYWSEKTGANININNTIPDNIPTSLRYQAKDFYRVSCVDPIGETTEVTRVKYALTSSNNKITVIDLFGYYSDAEVVVSYKHDLSYLWYDPSIFDFTGPLPDSTGSNLTTPFEKDDNDIYGVGVFTNYADENKLRIVENSGSPFLLSPGYTGQDTAEPILVASSNGHCTQPKLITNYNNDLFLIYEDTETNHQQIKIKGTGDLIQNSFIGSKGSFVSNFLSAADFKFAHEITEKLQGVNQLADAVCDKSSVIHVTWQSSRDGRWEIYYANSTNCFDPVRITETTGRSLAPSIDVSDDGNIYVSYHDDKFGKYQVLVSYKQETRILPLLEQDEYLASLYNDYTHYVDHLIVPIKNNTNSDICAEVIVKFFDNRLGTGSPSVILSSVDNPTLFQTADETGNNCAEGKIYVKAFDETDVTVLADQSGEDFGENSTYFVSTEYIYDGQTITDSNTFISYSCLSCHSENSAKWVSSFYGQSDTRVSDTTGTALNPQVKSKSSGKIIILWEDDKAGSSKIMGSIFDPTSTSVGMRASGGTWFDYDYNITGKNQSFCTDLFDRIATVYEKESQTGTDKLLPTTTIAYKVCDFDPLPEKTSAGQPNQNIGDYSDITSNVLSDDTLVSEKYIKQLYVLEDYVDYYTRDASGKIIPIVSDCDLRIGLIGTPEVVAYRIKNENETNYSSWVPFKPSISNYFTEIDHKLSPNPGVKEVCVQVATYSGITTSFYLTIIADYALIPYDIVLTKTGAAETLLPTYDGSYVASTTDQASISINVYIIIPVGTQLSVPPVFDFIQQGFNDVLGRTTLLGELPAGIDISGTVYKSFEPVVIYKDDGRYNQDGIARVKPRFESECISEYYRTESHVKTDNDYNFFGEVSVSDVSVVGDVLSQYRDPKTGKIGVSVDGLEPPSS